MVAALELLEHMGCERTARHLADMKLHAVALVRRVRHREVAPFAVLQNKIEMLSGLELDPDAGGKAQMHVHHVVGEPV